MEVWKSACFSTTSLQFVIFTSYVTDYVRISPVFLPVHIPPFPLPSYDYSLFQRLVVICKAIITFLNSSFRTNDMAEIFKRGNDALNVNKNVQPTLGDISLTTHGSDWYWTVTAVMAASTLFFMAWSFKIPRSNRIFHYITASIVSSPFFWSIIAY